MANLVRHLATRHAAFLAACTALLALFQYLMCAAVSSADIGGALETLTRSLPPLAQAFIATQFPDGLGPRGLLAFGWNHPVAHALGTAVAIVLAARAVAGECEVGMMELHLSQPMSRARWFVAHALFGLGALALLTLAGIAGTVVGVRVYGLERFAPVALAKLGLAYLLLQAAWFGVALALSAGGREGGRVAGAAFMVAVVSFFAQAIGRLWGRAAFVLPWTPHHYYSPQEILVEGAPIARPALVLGALAAAGLALAWARFRRRDLP